MRCARIIGPAAMLAAGMVLGHAALAASADKGKIAYIQHGCWQCHGFQGQGASTGAKLAPEPIALEAFTAFVRSTDRNMPPYSETVVSNEDLADIHAYLQSVPNAADYTRIPLLNE
jgi:ubiquinol-cytochrome c reductase cytochrome c subunit